MRKLNAKGFTLAELLIVVAIIAVLVAVSIPVFSTQLEKSREETDVANLRSAYAIAQTDALTGDYRQDGNTAGKYAPKAGSAYANQGDDANALYYAFYDIQQGILISATDPKYTANTGKGKGTGAKGNCEAVDGPIYYDQETPASNNRLMVFIKDNDGIPTVYVGFAAAAPTSAGTPGYSDDHLLTVE